MSTTIDTKRPAKKADYRHDITQMKSLLSKMAEATMSIMVAKNRLALPDNKRKEIRPPQFETARQMLIHAQGLIDLAMDVYAETRPEGVELDDLQV